MTSNPSSFSNQYEELLDCYRIREAVAQKKLPFLAQAAFQPIHFLTFSWPTRLKSISDLKNLADSMHENRKERWLGRLGKKGGGLSSNEISLMATVAERVGPMFKALSLPAPGASLINAFFNLRMINDIFPKCNAILEIGPGSGWLSLLLALSRKRTLVTVEVTENFYLWQSLLFKCFPEIELRQTLDGYLEERNRTESIILHAPWWEHAELRRMPLNIDLVVANHVVCEMHEHSLRYILKLATTREAPPQFLIEGEGDQRIRKWEVAVQIFREYGYDFKSIEIGVFLFTFNGNLEATKTSVATRAKEKLSLHFATHIHSDVKEKEALIMKESLAEFHKFSEVVSDTQNLNEEFLNWLQPNNKIIR